MIDYLLDLLGLGEYQPQAHEPELSQRWRRDLIRQEGLIEIQPPPAQSDSYLKHGPVVPLADNRFES